MTHLIVTDHALLRYLERVKGLDLEQYRQEIRASIARNHTRRCTATTEDGAFVFVVELNTVVTVLTPAQHRRRPARVGGPRTLVLVPTEQDVSDAGLGPFARALAAASAV